MNQIFVAPYRSDACCLCGSTENLSGEHKIKASLIKSEFGNTDLLIGRLDDSMDRPKRAQGPKSKAFHFSSRMCVSCNGSRTQAADDEFHRFHSIARQIQRDGQDPATAFENSRYAIGSSPYLNLFRYFAKILCCQMAEAKAPRLIYLSRFAIGEVHRNCVWLTVDKDWTYQQIFQKIGPHQYAAHGGLVMYGDKKTDGLKAFHTTLSIGPVRYVFFSRLTWLERSAIKLFHRDFHTFYKEKVRASMIEPLSLNERKILGFD